MVTAQRLRRRVATTTVYNVATAATAGAAGVIIARTVGPEVRGQYAAVVVWLGIATVLAQAGQPAAVTYHVARDRIAGRDYVATARSVMMVVALVVVGVAIVAAPWLAGGDSELANGYRVALAGCLAVAAGTAYTYSLQAVHLGAWNVVKFSQPGLYLAVVVVLAATGRLDLAAALWALLSTFVVQAAIAWAVARRHAMTGGRAAGRLAVARGGLVQFTSAAPVYVSSRLDQLALSLLVPAAALGHYAVAATLTGFSTLVVAGVGQVALPLLASGRGAARLAWSAVGLSAVVAGAMMAGLAVAAPWLVPFLFGGPFTDAVPLVWLLCPGGVFLAVSQVAGDLLRGQGRPLEVTRWATVAVVVLAAMLAVLIPAAGAVGAAVGSTVAAGVGMTGALWGLRRPDRGAAEQVEVGRAAVG